MKVFIILVIILIYFYSNRNMASVSDKIIRLDAFQEVSISVCSLSEIVSVELLDGSAEIFGVEMIKNAVRTFSSSFAVHTSSGCTLKFIGAPAGIRTQSTNSVIFDIHKNLQESRERAFVDGKLGPIVLFTGPTDVGKSTMTRSLLNYAVRCNTQPIFIDLDVGQSSISLPGTVGILPVDCPGDLVKGYCEQKLSVYFFGHKSPGFNMLLYFELINKLGVTMHNRLEVSPKVSSSGAIIDTCGWITGQGYFAILHAARSFQVSTVFVIEDRELYANLKQELPTATVTFLNKLDGVTVRSKAFRTNKRKELIQEYFYGADRILNSYLFEIEYRDFRIIRICSTAGKISQYMYDEPHKYLVTKNVPVDHLMINQILAISYASTVEEVITTSVLGFICVKYIDIENRILKVLSPQPGPLPNNILIAGDIFYET